MHAMGFHLLTMGHAHLLCLMVLHLLAVGHSHLAVHGFHGYTL